MRHGLLVAPTDGDWREVSAFRDRTLECVAAGGGRAFCGTFDTGLWRTTDGTDWTPVGDLPNRVMAVAVDPHDPAVIWAGTEPSAVYRSADGGRTFEERPGLDALPSATEWSFPPRPDTHHVRWLEPDPAQRGRLYVGIEAGALVRTDDGGRTWRDRPDGARYDNHTLATHPDDPGRVYAAAGDGYAESTDGGDHWTYPQAGLEHRYVWGVAVHPDDPETRLVAAASGARRAHSRPAASYVYRRTADTDWRRVDGVAPATLGDTERPTDALPTGEGALRPVLAAAADGAFGALTDRGLYRSTDGGREWQRVDTPWRAAFVDQTPRGLAL